MEINLKQAISMFFSQSSFDMVYLEAVANALDAGASKYIFIFCIYAFEHKVFPFDNFR